MQLPIISQVRSATREMIRQFGYLNNRYAAIGSTSQCHAMVEIDKVGVMTISQLVTVLNLEKSTVSRLLANLVERRICHIEADKVDKRVKNVSLTKKGTILVNKIHVETETQVRQALEMMSQSERDIVVKGLSIYANALKQSNTTNEE